jgi:hypothetical protein
VVQQQILEAIDDEQLRVYVVWTPVLREDNREAAVMAKASVTDPRAVHFWDTDKSLGNSLGKIVTLPRGRTLAWDVYFVFDADAQWYDEPPQPAVWMHQLGVDERTLDGDRLRQSVTKLLEMAEIASPK